MDTRIAWMKLRVYAALGLNDEVLFEKLLCRECDGGKVEQNLIDSLDLPSKQYPPALIFYTQDHEVEEMVEVVEGK